MHGDQVQKEEAEMLARFGGRRKLLVTVIGVFLESYPGTMRAISQAVAQRNAVALEESAHKLKGAIANLLMGRAYELARDLEERGRETRWEDVDATRSALEEEMERFDEMLQAVVDA